MTNSSNVVVRLFLVTVASAAIALVTMLVVFAANIAAYSQGQERVKASLASAIADASILETAEFSPWALLSSRFGNGMRMPIYRHDCLLWTTLLAAMPGRSVEAVLRVPRLEAATQPLDPRVPANPDCQAVAQVLAPAAEPSTRPDIVFYDRYIIGQRAISHVLLDHFSVRTSAIISMTATIFVFGLSFVLAWRKRAWAICCISALFLLFFGLGHFGGMLYFAPLDVAHGVVLLTALYMPLGAARSSHLILLGGLYGSVIAVFEILTGGIPMALVLLSLLTGLSAHDRSAFVYRISILIFSFAIAVISCFAIKLVAVSAMFNVDPFTEFYVTLVHRFRGDIVPEMSPTVIQYLAHRGVDIVAQPVLYLFLNYANWSSLIGWGSPLFGSLLVSSGLILLIAATTYPFYQRSRPMFSPVLLGCWLGLGVLLAWVCLFWNHTLLHAFFMARLLLIPLLCGAIAAVAAIEPKR